VPWRIAIEHQEISTDENSDFGRIDIECHQSLITMRTHSYFN